MLIIPHSTPYITHQDKEAILSCFESDYVGFDDNIDKEIKDSLSSYLSYKHIHITPSASISLLLILKYIKIEYHEVILSPINCWSVYNTIQMENGIPVIADTRSKNDFRISYDTIVNKINNTTKCIIITHMFGSLVEEEIIQRIKISFPNIFILEDFSTSLFSSATVALGRYSDFAIGSFGSTKPLTGGIGGVLCSQQDMLNTHYDTYNKERLSFNVKLSRLNQTLLLSQIQSWKKYQNIKQELLHFYTQFVTIHQADKSSNLLRAVTFEDTQELTQYLKRNDIKLDIRTSIQPNFAKALGLKMLKNAYTFLSYSSIPLNIKAYTAFKNRGLM